MRFSEEHRYLMPAHFGGQAGDGAATTYWDTVSATIRYRTEREALAALIPDAYTLRAPELMVSAMMNRGVEWMGGEPYNILSVNAPVTHRAEGIEGWYSLVVWENKATPILPGREQTGIPKIYGEVEDFRFLGDEMRTWAHYGGHSFCDMHFTGLAEASANERAAIDGEFAKMNWMAWRYIPNTGVAGAKLSHATIFPQEFESTQVRLGKCAIEWSVPPPWKNPTQAHIIGALKALPVGEAVGPAIIMNAKNILRGDLARELKAG